MAEHFFKFINLNLISPNQTACTQADLFYCMPHNNHYHKPGDVGRVAAKTKKKKKTFQRRGNSCELVSVLTVSDQVRLNSLSLSTVGTLYIVVGNN